MTEKIMALDTVVPGVFASREAAEAAIADLRELGFADDTLGVIVPDPIHHRLLDDSTHEALIALERGILFGVPLGFLGGIALAALVAPGIGVIGVGGALLFGGAAGALWGAITGSFLELTTEIHHLEDIERKFEFPLAPEEVLVVVVADPERSETVREVMRAHGARIMRDMAPVRDTA